MSICFLAALLLTLHCAAEPEPVAAQTSPAAGNIFDIREFGATAGEGVVNTGPVQQAIDKCTASGGGTVLVVGGRFVTGTIYLKDNVTLRIEQGSALLEAQTSPMFVLERVHVAP